jgi:hypothetical protein
MPSKLSILVYAPLEAYAQVIVPPTNNFLVYENSTAGIKINYNPSDWQIINPSILGSTSLSTIGGDPSRFENVTIPVGFVSTLQDAFFIIEIEQLDQNATLDSVDKELVESLNLTNPASKNVFGNLSMQGIEISDLTIVEHSITSLAGNPAQKIVSTAKVDYTQIPAAIELTTMYVYTMKDQKAYNMQYIGLGDSYVSHLESAQKMIDSFEIIN